MFQSPGDIAYTIGVIDIHWYGVIMSISILLGLFVIFFIKKHYYDDISIDSICDLSFVLIIFGIISARLYYVLLDYHYFTRHPFEIFSIWNGGISIQGAIIGGILIGLVYAKQNNIKFLRYADLFSFGLVTGQIFGRWGNFFNSEAFGLPTDLPWKLYIPYASRPIEYKSFEFFHPTFLYESILSFCILIVLFFILKKLKNRKDGLIFFMYIILYSLARIFVESIRIDSIISFNNIHIAQIVALFFIIFSMICIIFLYKNKL